jgi:AraC family transcriptional activator of pobA
MGSALPLFHLYGDPPDDSVFDFIHIETIASRSSIHDWTIRAHRHRNLFQILLIEKGGGDMSFETATARFTAPAVILVPRRRMVLVRAQVTDGWAVSFTEDAADALGIRQETLARPGDGGNQPLLPASAGQWRRGPTPPSALRADLYEGRSARPGEGKRRLAMRGPFALIAFEGLFRACGELGAW